MYCKTTKFRELFNFAYFAWTFRCAKLNTCEIDETIVVTYFGIAEFSIHKNVKFSAIRENKVATKFKVFFSRLL